jgi:hypothetical protein
MFSDRLALQIAAAASAAGIPKAGMLAIVEVETGRRADGSGRPDAEFPVRAAYL